MIDNQTTSIILPARIVEYFPLTQTATIQISAETIYSNAAAVSELKTREPIEEVPVHTVSGGGWSLTMPIKAGDTCLMFFSQVGYDHWLYDDRDTAGKIANLPKPWLRRQFHEDDGLALVGFNTLPRAIKAYSANNSEWRNDDATQVIRLKEDLAIEIDSPVSVTINAPAVTINCGTSTVNASNEAVINAKATSVTSDSVDITSPETTISGNLNVGGLIKGAGGLAVSGGSGAAVTGSMTTSGDVTAGGVSLLGHTHRDAEGRPTDPPT